MLAVVSVGTGCGALFQGPDASHPFTDEPAASLAEAVADGDREEVSELVAGGADPNAAATDGTTMLQWSIIAESADGMAALLAAGADPNKLGRKGRAPLHDAAEQEDATYVQLLLGAGADPDIRWRGTGSTPLKDSCQPYLNASFEALVAAGADVNAVDANRDGPIHACARTNAGALLLRLLELGADPSATNSAGATFQDYYFQYDRKILNERTLREREAVIAWLEQHGIPVSPAAYR